MGSEPADGLFDLAHAQQALWRNYAGYSGLGAHLPGGKLTADGPIHWVDSGGPLFSRVFETALGEADADNAIDLLRASFARRRHTLAWLVEERSTPGDLGKRLERAGLRHAYDWLGMARDLAVHPPRPRDIPRGVGLIRVGAAKALWGWVDVTAEAFGIHPSVVNRKYAAFARFVEAEPQSVTPWILTSGGFAVAAILTYDDGENIGLYWHFVDLVWIFLFPLLYLF